MTHIHFTGMRALSLLVCVSLVALLTACGNGYYDANGNYTATDNAPLNRKEADNTYYNNDASESSRYTRRGYYDYNGYYAESDGVLEVPQGMFPHRGMCRVWFTDRLPSQQPAVESCNGIQSRAPAGTYVIYGG